MTTSVRTLAVAAALLAAGSLAAQAPDCPHGPADDQGIGVNVAVLAHPTRVAAVLDSVLAAQGYQVSSSPAGVGRWTVAPRFTWLAAVENDDWHGDEHPGVMISVSTEARGDSTGIEVGAQTLCSVPARPGVEATVDEMVELMSATYLAAGVMESVDSLRARGTDPMTPVERPRISLEVPEEVAGFRLVDSHVYDDPAAGTTFRYTRPEDAGLYVDIYLYPGTRVDETCNAACAVDGEADGFVEGFPELIRVGHYQQVERTADERLRPSAGAAWAYGRHLTLKVRRQGQPLDSHYWLYSFPGFFLKVRASYPPTSRDAPADVRAFVDALLSKVMP